MSFVDVEENNMNREILFRGKRIDNCEWVEGVYFPSKDGDALICTNIVAGTPVDETGICIARSVDPDTVGQYTGLTDKNGKKIFEGDIVVWTSKVMRLIGNYTYCFDGYHEGDVLKVVCNEVGFMLDRLDDSIPDVPNGSSKIDNYAFWFFHRLLEIIGNIHDNPELIDGEQDV